MLILLPEHSLRSSVLMLDDDTLKNHINKCYRILGKLDVPFSELDKTPSVKLWAYYEDTLYLLGQLLCYEYRERKGRHHRLDTFFTCMRTRPSATIYPEWYDKDYVTFSRAVLFNRYPDKYTTYNTDAKHYTIELPKVIVRGDWEMPRHLSALIREHKKIDYQLHLNI